MKRAAQLALFSSLRLAEAQQLRGMGTLSDRDVCIVGAARTPFGAFLGSLSSLSATKLGSAAIKGAVERSGIDPSSVQEVFMGNVMSANLGQAPARQAALGAGLPSSAPCTQVNKVCASGLKAVMLGAMTIQTGMNDVVVAGGMESMSSVPHYAPGLRGGVRMGASQLEDGMLRDGLWDAHLDVHMGEIAERCADEHGIGRQQQDDHAVECGRRVREAEAAGLLANEIVALEVIHPRTKSSQLVERDEPPAKFDATRVPSLRPAFRPQGGGGTVTAANASVIADGAAAVVLASGGAARRQGLQVLGCIRGMADAAQDPGDFPTSPAVAARKLLASSGLEVGDIDYWEVNEAFSVVHLVNQKLLGMSPDRINVHGGAVVLGHPIGASGCRLVVTLLNVLRTRGGRWGIAVICNGGGGASAVLVERVDDASPADSGSKL